MTNYTETLELIADCHKEGFDKEDFAKELGVPSDSIGWMRLDILRPMVSLCPQKPFFHERLFLL